MMKFIESFRRSEPKLDEALMKYIVIKYWHCLNA